MPTKKIAIGDKVRFIKEVGGGIVKRCKGKTLYVEDDNGFEIPMEEQECIVVDEKDTFVPAYKTPKQKREEENAISEHNNRVVSLRNDNNKTSEENNNYIKGKDKLNLKLVFVPQAPTNLGQSTFDTYLVNDSNYSLLFTYLNRDYCDIKKWNLIAEGVISPNEKLFIEEITHSKLNDMGKIAIHILAFMDDTPFNKITPTEVEIRLDQKKFIRRGCFVENPLFDKASLLIDVVKDNLAVNTQPVFMPKKKDQSVVPSTSNRKTSHNVQPSYIKEDKGQIIVDLHIDNLVDSRIGMESKDMLDKQLEVFHSVMKEYEHNVGKQIVFIHGKGNGVLRKNIYEELKLRYRHTDYQDASFIEYGYGATLITIHTKDYDNRKRL